MQQFNGRIHDPSDGSPKSLERGFLSGPRGKEESILTLATNRPLLSKRARQFAENRRSPGNASLSEKCEAFLSLDKNPPGGRSLSPHRCREIRALATVASFPG